MKKIFATAILMMAMLLVPKHAGAAITDTLNVKSKSMDRDIKVLCISPENTEGKWRYPVIYLLHGHGGFWGSWAIIKPELKDYADKFGVIFVCPDGQNSWYWDSPVDPSYKFETFVSKELVEYIDSSYKTLADRKYRAITGLSMGGHGALWNAIRHKDVFGAAGSTSGGLDFRPWPESWSISDRLGSYKKNKKVWDEHTVINLIDDNLENGDLDIIIDCGTEDFFSGITDNVHNKLMKKGIQHDFIKRPGVHNLKYWNNSIDYQIMFFLKSFAK